MITTLKGLKKKYGPQVQRPKGVPKVPKTPHPGATRNWDPRTRRIAELIEWKFDVTCSTYAWHGNNDGNGGGSGERNAIDIWITYPKTCANPIQEAYGDKIQNFIENNLEDFPWFYQIWWDWMRYYYANWFSYEPYWRDYVKQSGNPNACDNRHMNHVHVQVQRGPVRRALTSLARSVGAAPEPTQQGIGCHPPTE